MYLSYYKLMNFGEATSKDEENVFLLDFSSLKNSFSDELQSINM